MIRTQARAESHTPRNRARARALLLAMSLGLCAPAIAAGQQFRGTVVGTVTDPSGALVRGARVTLIELDTNASLATETNGEGFYVLEYIPPGRYRSANRRCWLPTRDGRTRRDPRRRSCDPGPAARNWTPRVDGRGGRRRDTPAADRIGLPGASRRSPSDRGASSGRRQSVHPRPRRARRRVHRREQPAVHAGVRQRRHVEHLRQRCGVTSE